MNTNKMILINSIITPFMKHPLSLGMMLIIQTTMICLSMSMMTKSSWYSYILFISIISGMMIMFMYMASIVSNKKFKINKSMMLIMMIMLMMILFYKDTSMETLNLMNENKFYSFSLEEMKSTTKFFNLNKSNLTISIIIILFITMVAVTNMISSFEGPLKKK